MPLVTIRGRTHPVAAATKRNTLGTHGQGEDLRHDDPRDRAPGIGKVDDVNPDESHTNPSCGLVIVEVILVGPNDSGHDEVTRCHSNRTSDQDTLASKFVNI